MSDLYCNNGCPYERIGKCPENGMPERCGIQAMYAELAAVKAERDELKDQIVMTIDKLDPFSEVNFRSSPIYIDMLNESLRNGVQDGKEQKDDTSAKNRSGIF